MRIGPYQIHAIETGRFALDGGAMFGVVPKNLWNKTNPADDENRITLAARCLLLVHDNGRKVLIDNGFGHKFNEKFSKIYRTDHQHSSLERSLKALGVKPSDITDAILTHLHFDHAGGSTCKDENGSLSPTFEKATYYVRKEHLEYAHEATEKDRASFLSDDFMPLVERGVLEVLETEAFGLPGIEFFIANGHSPYQQLPIISDGKTTLFFCGDLIPTTTHIGIPYVMAYDNEPLRTIQEKKRLLTTAFDEQWILFFEHDPNTAAAYVRRDERGFRLGEAVSL